MPIIKPMLPCNSQPFDSKQYLFEIKWDGYRCLSYISNTTILRSRNLLDITRVFPEFKDLHHIMAGHLPSVLDGELVVFEDEKPSFTALQSRFTKSMLNDTGRKMIMRPAVFIIFDVVYYQGNSTMELPLESRRAILEKMIQGEGPCVLSPYVMEEGKKLFEACVKKGLEGVVAKKVDSIYVPGRRCSFWKKIKHNNIADLVVVGYQLNSTKDSLKSLVLGGHINGILVYQGKVSSGLTRYESELLLKTLKVLRPGYELVNTPEKEKKNTIWVLPSLVCSVSYLATMGYKRIRQPVYKGLRLDKDPEECLVVSKPNDFFH